ncbi:cellulose synthase [Variovorax gossypii]
MQSILEILVINTKTGKSKKTGNDYSIPEAQCVLRNDDQSVAAVGVLVIPKHLEDQAKPGLFTGSFALEAATFGENQGRIVAKLVGLTPLPPSALRRQPAAPAA